MNVSYNSIPLEFLSPFCNRSFSTSLLLQEQNLLLHDRVIFQHREGSRGSWAHHGAEEACHGHADEADGDGAGFLFEELASQHVHWKVERMKKGREAVTSMNGDERRAQKLNLRFLAIVGWKKHKWNAIGIDGAAGWTCRRAS
jgi:hypothetical protein